MRNADETSSSSDELPEGDETPPALEKPLALPTRPLVMSVLLFAAALSFAFQPERADTNAFFFFAFAPYALVGGVSAFFLARAGRLVGLLRLRRGDFTIGVLLGGLLVLGTWIGRTTIASLGEGTGAWLYGVYLQVGDPRRFGTGTWTCVALVMAALHELYFHGLLQGSLEETQGPRKGYLFTVGLSALAFAPTLYSLRAPGIGANPLIFLAALLAALLLGATRRLSGRLTPGIIARTVFLYFTLAQFRLPGI